MTFIFPRSHLAGMTLSTAGSSATFGVAAGQCADDANTVIMNASSAFTKTTSTWAEGTGGGALLDVGSIVNGQWYHVLAMQRPDTLAADYGVSTGLTPTLPGAYTTSRRIGSIRTDGSGNWLPFIQVGDEVHLFNNVVEVSFANANILNSTAVVQTLVGVPTGVQVNVMLHVGLVAPSNGGIAMLITSMDENDVLPNSIGGSFNSSMAVPTAGFASQDFVKRTNTLGQIRYRTNTAGGNAGIGIYSYGYIDRRGKDA